MCQSYRKPCECGRNTAEVFFGRMILDETSVARIFCPECSGAIPTDGENTVARVCVDYLGSSAFTRDLRVLL